jgi:arginase
MAAGAQLEIPYPDTGSVERDTLEAQTAELAAALPERPLVLGGCCCSHVGAVRGLAGRVERLAVVWLDAHGDLNTPETSPSGNTWGMPLRMLLDDGVVPVSRVALVGARNLDPPEAEFMAASGLDDSLDRALADAGAVYVALDVDVLDPGEAAVLFPEPDGPGATEVEAILRDVVGL